MPESLLSASSNNDGEKCGQSSVFVRAVFLRLEANRRLAEASRRTISLKRGY